MSRHNARARTGQDRTGLYQEITDKIIAELEAGPCRLGCSRWGQRRQSRHRLAMPQKRIASQRAVFWD